MTDAITFTDVAGQEWGVGDYVVYGSRHGSTMYIRYARVERIEGGWVQKFTGGYWDYKIQATLLRDSGGTTWSPGKKVILTETHRIAKSSPPKGS